MPTITHFEKGDRVQHPKRPEWGSGTVRDTQAITHEGQAAQRVTIDFVGKGRVVINAAVAPLEKIGETPAAKRAKADKDYDGSAAQLWAGAPTPTTKSGSGAGMTAVQDQPGGGAPGAAGKENWLDELETAGGKKHELWELPDELNNPFATPEQRLKATLDTYKYSTEPRALIEWARRQTGLDDPLTRYTRPELEQAFPRFARDRDAHLRAIVRDLKRANDMATIKASMKGGLIPAAQSAIDRAIRA
ncbi:MAG: DUF3553 domain-containing protein [Planctomycetota bacterium]